MHWINLCLILFCSGASYEFFPDILFGNDCRFFVVAVISLKISYAKVYKPFVPQLHKILVEKLYILLGLLFLIGSVFAIPGTAVRSLPTEYTALVPANVSIDVTPLVGTSVWGIEEYFPVNWVVSDINCEGIGCTDVDHIIATNSIQWIAIGAQNSIQDLEVILSYKVTPPIGTIGDIPFSGMLLDYVGVTYNEINISGNTVISKSNTPPTVTLTSSGEIFTALASFDINATASDPDGTINRVEFYNGETLITSIYTLPYNYTLNNIGPGTYTFKARAYDDKNAYTDSNSIIITVIPDLILPNVSITNPPNGAVLNGTVSITADAADNIGVVGVQFKLDGKNLGNEDLNLPYSIDWNTSLAITGGHILTAVARDAAGNLKTSSVINVVIIGGLILHPYDIDKDFNIDNNEFNIVTNCWKNPAACGGTRPDFRYYVNAAYLNTAKIWSNIYGYFYHAIFGVLCPPNSPDKCWALGN